MALNEEQKRIFEEMISQFKELVPNLQINEQPRTAREKLLTFEQNFQINTTEIFQSEIISKTKINNNILEEWKTMFNTFIIHKGNIEDINHIQVSNRAYLGDEKLNKDKYGKEANPYGFASLFTLIYLSLQFSLFLIQSQGGKAYENLPLLNVHKVLNYLQQFLLLH